MTRSIESRFKKFLEMPGASTVIAFSLTVEKQGFNKDRIRRAFNKLVEPDDYAKNEKIQLLDFFYKHSKK